MIACKVYATAVLIVSASATCYFYDGEVAGDDEPCGFDTNFCCPSGDTCVTNGLCQDKNNHLNGSLTFFAGDAIPGPYNYTNLYASASCTNDDWTGCSSYCLTSDATQYIWACNYQLTEFCCHDISAALGNLDCCNGTTFQVESALVALDPTSSSSAISGVMQITVTVTGSATQQATTTTSSSSSPTTVPSASSSSTAVSTSSQSALSTGAKAGIGLGAAAVFFFGIGVFVLWRNLRRWRLNSIRGEPMMDPLYSTKQPLSQEKKSLSEVHGQSAAPHELATLYPEPATELPSENYRTPEHSLGTDQRA